MALQWKARYS